ncbi:MAG TPA: GTPase HflX [Miltoncostaeaceae bacterium]|nr:GTPase HflX [Miltoncostaeaceae bacterium]
MPELQRTYRGSAARPEEDLDRRGPERAIVIASLPGDAEEGDRLAEFEELLRTAGAEVVETLVQRREQPVPRTYLGRGRLEELKLAVERRAPDLVAAEGPLTPGQQRSLEDRLKTRVVDRTAVILDIFAQHARSAEGKLQVELAQLEYSYARQEGLWQHLERLGGGVGTRGPGETQLESDRRLLRSRMATLRRRLRDVARSRETQRERRAAAAAPRIALAGYTNAGKSSLMNALTGAGVRADDALFETLDPTTRRVAADGHELLLSDTVGFIRNLPHQLVTAFSATLEEVRDADLILHVADAHEPEGRRAAQARAVADVLDDIGASQVPRLVVLNKIDLVPADERTALANRQPRAVRVSAVTGEGLDELRSRLAEAARAGLTPVELTIPYAQSGLISAVYSDGREIEQESTEEGTRVRALMPPAAAARLRAALNGSDGLGRPS